MRRTPLTVIEQNNVTGGISYWQGVDNQSLSDRRGVSLADYIHVIYGFIRQAKCKRVLMIGCGGGTLATMLSRVGVAVTIVDINATSFEIARTYFAMPESVDCQTGDGAAYLRRDQGRRFDAIVLDAYSGGAIPRQFLRPAFFALAKTRLARGGIVLANVLAADDDDPRPDHIARLMKTAWHDVRILDADGYVDRNVVVIAGAVRKLRPPRLLLAPARCAKSIARNLKGLDFRAVR
jgi:spermidine synthase